MTRFSVICVAGRPLSYTAVGKLATPAFSPNTVGGPSASPTTPWVRPRRPIVDSSRLDLNPPLRHRGRGTHVARSLEISDAECQDGTTTQSPTVIRDVINGGGESHVHLGGDTRIRRTKKKRDALYKQQHNKRPLHIPEEEWPR